MARQTGTILLSGTIDHLTYYIMNGKGYARKKSCLDKKRFFRKPSFSNSRRASSRFGVSNKLCATAYRELPRDERDKALYNELLAIATHMLKYQHSEEEVLTTLRNHTILKKKKAEAKLEASYKKPAQVLPRFPQPTNTSSEKSKRAVCRLRSYALPPNPS